MESTYTFFAIFVSCYMYTFAKYHMVKQWSKALVKTCVQVLKDLAIIFVVVTFSIVKFMWAILLMVSYPIWVWFPIVPKG